MYELKEKGLCPRVIVHQVAGEKEISYARLQLPGVDLYFHSSGKNKVEVKETETMKGKKLKLYSIPFDGWETNDYPSSKKGKK